MPTISVKKANQPQDRLDIIEWARDAGRSGDLQNIAVSLAERETEVLKSTATGQSLVTNGFLGADIIHLKAGEAFAPHTHPGDHLLIVIGGEGTVTFGDKVYPTRAGQIYMIEGEVPHAVGAVTDHVILAVGSPHKAIDSEDRMTLVEYTAIEVEPKD